MSDFCVPLGNYHEQYRAAQGLAAASEHTFTGTVIKLLFTRDIEVNGLNPGVSVNVCEG